MSFGFSGSTYLNTYDINEYLCLLLGGGGEHQCKVTLLLITKFISIPFTNKEKCEI